MIQGTAGGSKTPAVPRIDEYFEYTVDMRFAIISVLKEDNNNLDR